MKKNISIIFLVCMLLFTSLLTSVNSLETKDKISIDPGGIHGPIWGRIQGYEYTGPYKEHLELHTMRVRYFGIGFGADEGIYPRFLLGQDVTFYNPNFKGIITPLFIIGIINGLPY